MFNWLGLALALLKLANMIVSWLDRESLLNEGERRAYGKQLAENAKRAKLVKDVEERLGKASDAEILRELKDDFRD